MKLSSSMRIALAGITAVVLIAVGSVQTARAATSTPTLSAELVLRPLTPTEKTLYGLSSLQTVSGLSASGVGQPFHFELIASSQVAPTNILSVTWSLTKPAGSTAALADSSLGSNVPLFRMRDRVDRQLVGRSFLRPDLEGQYSVTVTIATATFGTTNLTQNLSVGHYMGANVCQLCHSGGAIAENIYPLWANTRHATKFTRGIDGFEGATYGKNCITCHTVGYDANTNAVNGGFDDVAAQLGWTFPATLSPTNWDAVPQALKNLANIQCENCHGPGSEHAYSFGNTNLSNWPRIGLTFGAGNCGQCHDSGSHHFRNSEWNNSAHATATRTPSGAGRQACARCHTGGGFAQYAATLGTTNTYTTNNADTTYTAITCATCHNPHDATNPHQFRAPSTVLLADGVTVVTNAGLGSLCMNCHRSRNGSVTNSIVKYPVGQQTWAGGSGFGPHDNPASDMLEGVNGWTYGQAIPSSAHRMAVPNTCVGCHMQEVESTDPAFTLAGGHTMNMSYSVITNGVTNTVDMVGACAQCHGPKDSFDFPMQDYNGDGVIEGVQTEVQRMLNTLSTLLPSSAYVANGQYVPDGLVKSNPSVKTNWPAPFLKAAYNFQFVNNDKSKGVHNAAYATGLLKASMADLTGNPNLSAPMSAADLAYYQWQIKYFGTGSNPNAAPDANPAGDGIPNWAKYNLGLDPTIPGTVLSDGVVWANGSKLYPGSETNTVKIYTAAEIAFNSEAGKNYQIQSISTLGGTWQNVGQPIPGTGNTISYVTPSRPNAKQFFRVVTLP